MENRIEDKDISFVFGSYATTDEWLKAVKLKNATADLLNSLRELAKASLFTGEQLTKVTNVVKDIETNYLENIRKAGKKGYKAGERFRKYIENTNH